MDKNIKTIESRLANFYLELGVDIASKFLLISSNRLISHAVSAPIKSTKVSAIFDELKTIDQASAEGIISKYGALNARLDHGAETMPIYIELMKDLQARMGGRMKSPRSPKTAEDYLILAHIMVCHDVESSVSFIWNAIVGPATVDAESIMDNIRIVCPEYAFKCMEGIHAMREPEGQPLQ